MQQSKRNCDENAIAVKNERRCKFCRKSFVTLARVTESQHCESLVADKYVLIRTVMEILMKLLIVPHCV